MKGKKMSTRNSNRLFNKTANRTSTKNLANRRQGMRGGFHF